MTLASVTLEDSFTKTSGRVYLTGTQALVKLPLLQKERDRRAGLNTAGFITGYRGSPLGGFDIQLWRQAERLKAADIHFEPGLNEDLAATAVWGTQQSSQFATATRDGVFSLWYGKGPGVDRSGDAIKHGNRNGAARHGGVLLAFGDDHAGKSSTTAHQSDGALAANGVPVLYPATVEEYLSFGLFGWALSRASGLWVGLKCVNETAEATATVDLPSSDRTFIYPPTLDLSEEGLPTESLHGQLIFDPNLEERIHIGHRLPVAERFAGANGIDRIVRNGPRRTLGLICTGKTYLDVLGALGLLGLDEARTEALGLRIYKLGMIWPVERQGLAAFAGGHDEILIIEEKQALIEQQVASILYNLPADQRPRLSGKQDPDGRDLVPRFGTLSAILTAGLIGQRLDALGLLDNPLRERLTQLSGRLTDSQNRMAQAEARRPWFCSGCPHNTSTRIPDGSMALSGIGCHTMALWMDRDTLPPTQMGGEGANWIGIAPFVETPHIFQNLGDGTYNHSGLLAIRAAVASGVNITYKILYNDAVAMTGGQPHDGDLTVPDILCQVLAERVKRVCLVTDDLKRYDGVDLPSAVPLHHRDDLPSVQEELRKTPGTTVLVYDQTCAAELRRRRKRGLAPDPDTHVVINDRVCEGCGDCSTQSNCVSVLPKQTEFGVKREIDQSSCNKDYSCLKGFCPSFVTVQGTRKKKRQDAGRPAMDSAACPEPARRTAGPDWSAVIAGIGGTGIVTIGALLSMAAHLEGKRFAAYDMTGLAQKGGAVFSHLRISSSGAHDLSPIVGVCEADLLLGCDLSVTATGDALNAVDPNRTRVILNDHATPPGHYQIGQPVDLRADGARRLIEESTADGQTAWVEAAAQARRLLGDSIGANMIMVGYAYQSGDLPVSADAIERAIEINGVAVAFNRQAFRIGRTLAHDPKALAQSPPAASGAPNADLSPLERRKAFLTAYQSRAYARRYEALVTLAQEADRRAGGTGVFAEAVLQGFFKLMAYKDEYEVARLYTDGTFREQIQDQFEDGYTLRFHLAPPILGERDKTTGQPLKRAFGPWMLNAFRLLAALRGMRGTPFDPFGYTQERRTERALIKEYEALIRRICGSLTPQTYETAVAIADFPQDVRGYGYIKERTLAAALPKRDALIKVFDGSA